MRNMATMQNDMSTITAILYQWEYVSNQWISYSEPVQLAINRVTGGTENHHVDRSQSYKLLYRQKYQQVSVAQPVSASDC